MLLFSRRVRLALSLGLALLAVPALAQQAASEAQMVLGRQIVAGSGLARSFEGTVPQMMTQIYQTIVRTRPELAPDLKASIAGLEPEFLAQTSKMVDRAAQIIATQLSEAEMKDIAGFFASASGKKYVATQPQALDAIVVSMEGWNREMSAAISERLRAEMKKKGHDL